MRTAIQHLTDDGYIDVFLEVCFNHTDCVRYKCRNAFALISAALIDECLDKIGAEVAKLRVFAVGRNESNRISPNVTIMSDILNLLKNMKKRAGGGVCNDRILKTVTVV